MSTPSSSTTPKNIIFVTGNAVSYYREIALALNSRLYRSVFVDEPVSNAHDYQGLRESAGRKSLFFSQVFFYGSLPSRRNIVVSAPNLSMKTILQFLILFEKVHKNVFLVVDDRQCLTPFSREKFTSFERAFPKGSFFSLAILEIENPKYSNVLEDELAKRIEHNATFPTAYCLHTFNEILTSVPDLFKGEIKKLIFGTEFGDIPFTSIQGCLIAKFNDAEEDDEEDEADKENRDPMKNKKIRIEEPNEEGEEDDGSLLTTKTYPIEPEPRSKKITDFFFKKQQEEQQQEESQPTQPTQPIQEEHEEDDRNIDQLIYDEDTQHPFFSLTTFGGDDDDDDDDDKVQASQAKN